MFDMETPAGKFIYKKFEKLKTVYDAMVKDAIESATKDKLLIFTYDDDKTSFTGDMANELLYKFPDKVILIGRKRSGEVKICFGADIVM